METKQSKVKQSNATTKHKIHRMENDDDDDDTVTAVQVAVRVRPFSEDEIAVWNDSQNARKGKRASDGGRCRFLAMAEEGKSRAISCRIWSWRWIKAKNDDTH